MPPTTNQPLAVDPKTGLLLVGHGTRQASGVEEFLRLARRLTRRAAGLAVAPCFLELARPTIAEGLAELARAGVQRVVVAPVILLAAGHIKRDIPQAVAAAAANYPRLRIEQAEHLGCHPRILELSKRRYEAAVRQVSPVPPPETALVLVGRGSSDSEAIREMHEFAQRRSVSTHVAQTRVAFVAVAEPRLDDVLAECVTLHVRRVVVQPHLLFDGLVLQGIAASVARMAEQCSDKQWLITKHLGPSQLVVQAVLDRVAELRTASAT